MRADQLHVFTARSNPLRWKKPHDNYLAFAEGIKKSGAHLHVVECAYGAEDFACKLDGVNHIGVRAKTRGWTKENLINLGVQRVPEAQYIAWVDADVLFRRPDWAEATVHALQHYDIVQPWKNCYDLGPSGEHLHVHTSFASQFFYRKELVPPYAVRAAGKPWWQGDGGPYTYPHSGFAWAMTRQAFDWVGGLFELGGMGSGDHHMALGLIGRAIDSIAPGASERYNEEVLRWERRARQHIAGNLGFVEGTIEHLAHGRKVDRGYLSRWGMFLKHGFDPHEDLKRNADGVFEFACNKPELRHDFNLYLHARLEDANTL